MNLFGLLRWEYYKPIAIEVGRYLEVPQILMGASLPQIEGLEDGISLKEKRELLVYKRISTVGT